MAMRVSRNGRVTIPKKVRGVLRLSPGDYLEFELNGAGEVIVHKARPVPARSGGEHTRSIHRRLEAQMRRRTAELIALLRGLD